MLQYGQLYLIGSSHISPESVKEVRKVIQTIKPAFVAVELDKGRLQGLLQKGGKKFSFKDVRRFGIRGFLFALAGSWVEERLGKVVKTKPGSEMKAAVLEAGKTGAKVVLIDQEIRTTINKLFKRFTWREKFRFLGDLVKGMFGLGSMQVKIDLNKVPSDALIEQMVGLVRDRYPSVYSVLIDERNKIMARRLHRLMEKHPDVSVVAVVGAGHVKGMHAWLQKASGDA